MTFKTDEMKIHFVEVPKGSKIRDGVVSELSYKALKPYFESAFRLKILSETIGEIQPTKNGIRIKIVKR